MWLPGPTTAAHPMFLQCAATPFLSGFPTAGSLLCFGGFLSKKELINGLFVVVTVQWYCEVSE